MPLILEAGMVVGSTASILTQPGMQERLRAPNVAHWHQHGHSPTL